jgi:hypothetical protein
MSLTGTGVKDDPIIIPTAPSQRGERTGPPDLFLQGWRQDQQFSKF